MNTTNLGDYVLADELLARLAALPKAQRMRVLSLALQAASHDQTTAPRPVNRDATAAAHARAARASKRGTR